MNAKARLAFPLWITLLFGALAVYGDDAAAETPTVSVPGVVIDHQPASTGKYVGSPSIAILPDGSYVASHDIFGPGSQYKRSKVFGSRDGGTNWQHLSDIDGAFWNTLFVHRDSLYFMGASARYGKTVIRRSDDGGRTWTTPDDDSNGLLLSDDAGYHCAPQVLYFRPHKKLTPSQRVLRGFESTTG